MVLTLVLTGAGAGAGAGGAAAREPATVLRAARLSCGTARISTATPSVGEPAEPSLAHVPLYVSRFSPPFVLSCARHAKSR